MNAFLPIGAFGIGDLIGILIFILFIAIPAIGQLMAKMRQPQQPGAPQRPVDRGFPAGPQPPPAPQAQQRPRAARPKSVMDEINEFLRRTVEQKEAAGKPLRRVAPLSPPSPKAEQPVKADVGRERPVGGQVTEHVRKYLDEKEFTQRASKLGGEVASADDKIEQHLRDVFGHGISQLAGKPGETAVAPKSMPTGFFEDEVPALPTALGAGGVGLAVLLNNINNLRQAIVINEILQRPIDRWE